MPTKHNLVAMCISDLASKLFCAFLCVALEYMEFERLGKKGKKQKRQSKIVLKNSSLKEGKCTTLY